MALHSTHMLISHVMDTANLGLDMFLVWGQYTFPFKIKHYCLVETEVYTGLCLYQVLESLFS